MNAFEAKVFPGISVLFLKLSTHCEGSKAKPLPTWKKKWNKDVSHIQFLFWYYCLMHEWYKSLKKKKSKGNMKCGSVVWLECWLDIGWVAVLGTKAPQIHNESETEKRIWRHLASLIANWILTDSARKHTKLPFVVSELQIWHGG